MSETENENQTTDEQASESAAEETVPGTPAGEEISPEAPAGDAAPEAEAEPAEEAPATEGAAPEATAADQPAERRKSRKRLPRSERHKHAKPKRERPVERKPITRLPKPEATRGRRQERRGVVVSSTMDKTIVVKVDTIKSHPRYKKVVRRSLKFHAHDPGNEANVGDIVRIVETRPISKTKNWRLAEILEAAK
jgi:small subunit ribosomal protein S17